MESIQFIGVDPEKFKQDIIDALFEKLRPKQDEWLSQREAAAYLKKSVQTIINWENKLNPDRTLGAPRYLKSKLEPLKK